MRHGGCAAAASIWHSPAHCTPPPPQNDFLRPFVVVMRHSRALEIRELIIRCVSQMVLARVANVKSGWKSMFMVRQQGRGHSQGQEGMA